MFRHKPPFENCTLRRKNYYQLLIKNNIVIEIRGSRSSHTYYLTVESEIFLKPKLTFGVNNPTKIGAMIPITEPQLLTIAMIVGA